MNGTRLKQHDKNSTPPTPRFLRPPLKRNVRNEDIVVDDIRRKVTARSPSKPTTHWLAVSLSHRPGAEHERVIEIAETEILRLLAEEDMKFVDKRRFAHIVSNHAQQPSFVGGIRVRG